MAVKDYNVDPDFNTTISGINIAEGCAPSGINNAIRQLMADVKEASEEQTSKDAEQDVAISKAQSSADAAKGTANAAVKKVDGAMPGADGNVPLNNVVHLSGNETITGLKTHTQNLYTKKDAAQVVLQNTAMTKGATPDGTLTTNVIFGTSGGVNTANSMAQIYATQHSNGNTSLNFRVFKNTANVSTSKIFSLIYNLDDTTGIKWGDEQVVCVASWKSGYNWYRKYSDGWIEQGGLFDQTSTWATVTLNTSFSNVYYTITTATVQKSDSSNGYAVIRPTNKTKTSFQTANKWDTSQYPGGKQYWYACGY